MNDGYSIKFVKESPAETFYLRCTKLAKTPEGQGSSRWVWTDPEKRLGLAALFALRDGGFPNGLRVNLETDAVRLPELLRNPDLTLFHSTAKDIVCSPWAADRERQWREANIWLIAPSGLVLPRRIRGGYTLDWHVLIGVRSYPGFLTGSGRPRPPAPDRPAVYVEDLRFFGLGTRAR